MSIEYRQHTVVPSFNIAWFNVFCRNFQCQSSRISNLLIVLNFYHLRYLSVDCSDPPLSVTLTYWGPRFKLPVLPRGLWINDDHCCHCLFWQPHLTLDNSPLHSLMTSVIRRPLKVKGGFAEYVKYWPTEIEFFIRCPVQ